MEKKPSPLMKEQEKLQKLFRDYEIYKSLLRHCAKNLKAQSPAAAEVLRDSGDVPDVTDLTIAVRCATNELVSKTNPKPSVTDADVPSAPSPTYSFPSISDDETVLSLDECESSNTPPLAKIDPPTSSDVAKTPEIADIKIVTPDSKANLEFLQEFGSVDEISSQNDPSRPLYLRYYKFPPLFVPKKNILQPVTRWCHNRVINFKATRTQLGVKFTMYTIKDYGGFVALLMEKDVKFHFYTSADNRNYHAVLRDIPTSYTCEAIKESLISQNYPVLEVYRLRRQVHDTYDMVGVTLPWTPAGRAITRTLTKVCDMTDIKIQQADRALHTQCKRCKYYGHIAENCKEILECSRCFGNHLTAECTEKIAEPPLFNGIAKPISRFRLHGSRKQSQHSQNSAGFKSKTPTSTYGQNTAFRSWSNSYQVTPNIVRSVPITTASKLTQTPDTASTSLETSKDLSPNVALVTRFANEIDIKEIIAIGEQIRRNEGNALALVQIGMQYASILEKLNSFRVSPE